MTICDFLHAVDLSVKIKGLVVKELFVNNRGVMECVITGKNKQDVKEAKVSWTRENIPETQVTEAEVQNTGEQYTKISTLTFNETYWFSGNTFKCSATWKQKHISDDISINKIGQKPTILIYKPEEINPHHVSLVCEINSSPSMDVYAIWTTNNQNEYIEGNITSPIFKKNNSKSVFNILTVTKQEYENVSSTFTCAVKYGGMKTPNIPLLVATSKNHSQQIVFCYDEEALDEDEFSSLWSTASSFIFLFIFSLIYSTVLSLSKMKS
uniref:Ig-like domain-containing protein n=1 Tax=Electrophorus electricus TaxID=8005 RepID=A0AAY5F104_ELEEL